MAATVIAIANAVRFMRWCLKMNNPDAAGPTFPEKRTRPCFLSKMAVDLQQP